MLKIEHIYKSFGEKPVLNDLNLEVKDGSVFGLVGVNGARKSTLLRTIAGVYQADSGSITLNDMDTYLCPEIRKEIAFAADEFYYPSGSTLQSLKVLYETMYDFDEKVFAEYCDLFELDVKATISNLSKGMKRRVSLVLALSIHPKLLLMDEAYDGLEPLARLRFKRLLAQRIEEEQISVIISSHNLRELEDICDSYGILEDGKIASYGDLIDNRGKVNKYQLAFAEEVDRNRFSAFDVLAFEQEGRVVQMVIRGEEEEVSETLNELHPLLLDVLPVTFEELFIYELESRGRSYE